MPQLTKKRKRKKKPPHPPHNHHIHIYIHPTSTHHHKPQQKKKKKTSTITTTIKPTKQKTHTHRANPQSKKHTHSKPTSQSTIANQTSKQNTYTPTMATLQPIKDNPFFTLPNPFEILKVDPSLGHISHTFMWNEGVFLSCRCLMWSTHCKIW